MADNLGTGRDIVDNNGDVLNHISYDSFGKRIAETNSAVDLIFGWTSRDFDEETGLQYNRARYYDPAVGRWISEDRIGFGAGDANLSRYVGNGPTNSTDPSGLDTDDPPSGIETDIVNDNTVPDIFWVDELPGREYVPGDEPSPEYAGVWDDIWTELKKLPKIFDTTDVFPEDPPKKPKIGQPAPPPPNPIGVSDIVDGAVTAIGTQAPPGMSEAAGGLAAIGAMCQPDNIENYLKRQMQLHEFGDPREYEKWKDRYERCRKMRADAKKKQ
ncbi:MAG: RHS repeat-associated core domain-containing protein [Planctomycetes bacterium]|nr:RHS repeat-associated core domain-containing protein [Planctomycetota bacterium]